MGLILSIDTATKVCSVSLAKDGDVIAIRETMEEKSHASRLTVFIEEVLQENNIQASKLDAVAVSKGPGSYTGLRIGVSTAKGLCYGLDKPLIAVSTLQALAYGALKNYRIDIQQGRKTLLCPMIDARRMEVFTALYDTELNPVSPIVAKVLDNNSFLEELKTNDIYFFASGAEKFSEIINHPSAFFPGDIQSSAAYTSYFAELAWRKGQFEDTAYFEPYYLKDFIATVPKKNILK